MDLQPPFSEKVYEFEVLNPDELMPHRSACSPLAPHLLAKVDRDGFVILRQFLSAGLVSDFATVVDETWNRVFDGTTVDSYSSGRFGGQYLRDLHAHSLPAWELLLDSGIPDLVRSMLGPRIVLRSYSVRVTHPGSMSSTVWHADQRARIRPRPPWFSEPHSVTVLGYLDAANETSGRTLLVPGSHRQPDLPPEELTPASIGHVEQAIEAAPGDALMFHGALWHRAEPTGPTGSRRRVLNLQFAPSWTKRAAFDEGVKQPAWAPAAEAAHTAGRTDILELLGLGGYM